MMFFRLFEWFWWKVYAIRHRRQLEFLADAGRRGKEAGERYRRQLIEGQVTHDEERGRE